MSQDLPHHNHLTRDSALCFIDLLVLVTRTNIVDYQELEVVGLFFCCEIVVFKNITNEHI